MRKAVLEKPGFLRVLGVSVVIVSLSVPSMSLWLGFLA